MANPTPQELLDQWVAAIQGTADIDPLEVMAAIFDDVLGYLRDSYYKQTSIDGSPIDNAVSDAITYFTETYL